MMYKTCRRKNVIRAQNECNRLQPGGKGSQSSHLWVQVLRAEGGQAPVGRTQAPDNVSGTVFLCSPDKGPKRDLNTEQTWLREAVLPHEAPGSCAEAAGDGSDIGSDPTHTWQTQCGARGACGSSVGGNTPGPCLCWVIVQKCPLLPNPCLTLRQREKHT